MARTNPGRQLCKGGRVIVRGLAAALYVAIRSRGEEFRSYTLLYGPPARFAVTRASLGRGLPHSCLSLVVKDLNAPRGTVWSWSYKSRVDLKGFFPPSFQSNACFSSICVGRPPCRRRGCACYRAGHLRHVQGCVL